MRVMAKEKIRAGDWVTLRKQGKVTYLTAGKKYFVRETCDLFGMGQRLLLMCDHGKKRHFWAKAFDKTIGPQ